MKKKIDNILLGDQHSALIELKRPRVLTETGSNQNSNCLSEPDWVISLIYFKMYLILVFNLICVSVIGLFINNVIPLKVLTFVFRFKMTNLWRLLRLKENRKILTQMYTKLHNEILHRSRHLLRALGQQNINADNRIFCGR